MNADQNQNDSTSIIKEIADRLRFIALWTIGGSVGLILSFLAILVGQSTFIPDPTSKLLLMGVLLGIGMFIFMLARGFRARKRWTLGLVTFIVESNSLYFPRQLRDGIEDPNLRRAFK